MLFRPGGRWLRPLSVLPLGARDPPLVRASAGGIQRSAPPVWAAASVSAVASGGPGSWYEALATSAPVQGTEEALLGVHSATGLPWWACIGLSTVALRGAVTLPLAAYQHYILAKVRAPAPCASAWAARGAVCLPGLRIHGCFWSRLVYTIATTFFAKTFD